MQAVDQNAAQIIDYTTPFYINEGTFKLPKIRNESTEPVQAYFLGHSLGPASRIVRDRVIEVLDTWENLGIRGHFEGGHPWYEIDSEAVDALSLLSGGKPHEVVLMNSLTVNLHLMLEAFYRPQGDRKFVLMEGGAFPSDRYGVQTHLLTRDLIPHQSIIEVYPRQNEYLLRTEDILKQIEVHGDKIALVFLGAVQFVSGQVLDIEQITKAAHAKGCKVGFDLAHAMGNIPLLLNQWGPDFAIGCGYKYLNGGAGDGGHAWVHERHLNDPHLVHLGGWWGNDPRTRFEMRRTFEASNTANRFALSNPPIFSTVAAIAGMQLFVQTARNHGGTLKAFWERREQLWQFLYDTVTDIRESTAADFEVITPTTPGQHGSMLSLHMRGRAAAVEKALCDEGFIVDARGDSVLRISTVPFWVQAEQIYLFGQQLRKVLAA